MENKQLKNKKVNVTIIGPSKKFLSGISYYTIRLANALNKGCNISVITIKNLLPKFLFPGKSRVGSKLSNLEFDKKIQVCNCLDYYIFPGFFKVINFLTKQNPDVIIMQWWSSSAAFNYLLLKIINKLFFNKKVIVEFHEILDPLENNIWFLRIYARLISKILFNDLEGYVVHSDYDKYLVRRAYNLKKENVFVIPLGPYDHYIKEIKIKDKKKIFDILFFGLIRHYKGLKYLIEAFDKIPPGLIGDFRLNIVGEIWDNKKAVYSMISNSKYMGKIKLVDRYISDEEVNQYFTLADVVVFPYTRASQSAVAKIAISYGKPIIISKIDSLKEDFENYEGTFFVEPRNSEQIKDKIIECFNLNAKFFKNEIFSWERTINLYRKIFFREPKILKNN